MGKCLVVAHGFSLIKGLRTLRFVWECKIAILIGFFILILLLCSRGERSESQKRKTWLLDQPLETVNTPLVSLASLPLSMTPSLSVHSAFFCFNLSDAEPWMLISWYFIIAACHWSVWEGNPCPHYWYSSLSWTSKIVDLFFHKSYVGIIYLLFVSKFLVNFIFFYDTEVEKVHTLVQRCLCKYVFFFSIPLAFRFILYILVVRSMELR